MGRNGAKDEDELISGLISGCDFSKSDVKPEKNTARDAIELFNRVANQQSKKQLASGQYKLKMLVKIVQLHKGGSEVHTYFDNQIFFQFEAHVWMNMKNAFTYDPLCRFEPNVQGLKPDWL